MNSIKIIAIFLISVSNFSTVHSHNSVLLSKLAKDIIENERVPSILHAKTCWSKSDDIAFVKDNSMPMQIVNSIAPIDLPYDDNSNKQWFFVDMNCKQYSTFLVSVDEKYFSHPYRWILIDATNDSIEHLHFLPDSNIILANRDPNSEQFHLKQGKINFFPVFHSDEIFILKKHNFVQNQHTKLAKGIRWSTRISAIGISKTACPICVWLVFFRVDAGI